MLHVTSLMIDPRLKTVPSSSLATGHVTSDRKELVIIDLQSPTPYLKSSSTQYDG